MKKIGAIFLTDAWLIEGLDMISIEECVYSVLGDVTSFNHYNSGVKIYHELQDIQIAFHEKSRLFIPKRDNNVFFHTKATWCVFRTLEEADKFRLRFIDHSVLEQL